MLCTLEKSNKRNEKSSIRNQSLPAPIPTMVFHTKAKGYKQRKTKTFFPEPLEGPQQIFKDFSFPLCFINLN